MNNTTLVIGASENPRRYSHLAILRLLHAGYPVKAIGKRNGDVEGIKIETGFPELRDIDTVTLYLNPTNQIPFEEYILKLKPKRVIFNPGTENPKFEEKLRKEGIEILEACTLVMLATKQY